MGEQFSFLQGPLKVSKIIDDGGTLSVSNIAVDNITEKTASHNIVAAVPITGSVSSLTLTGDLDLNGYFLRGLPNSQWNRGSGPTNSGVIFGSEVKPNVDALYHSFIGTHTMPANLIPRQVSFYLDVTSYSGTGNTVVQVLINGSLIGVEQSFAAASPKSVGSNLVNPGDIISIRYKHAATCTSFTASGYFGTSDSFGAQMDVL
jgi:hypothetical protein